jgi:hypothetical protein
MRKGFLGEYFVQSGEVKFEMIEQYLVLNYLYSSTNIVWWVKSNKMSWAGHLARTGRRLATTEIWWEKLIK